MYTRKQTRNYLKSRFPVHTPNLPRKGRTLHIVPTRIQEALGSKHAVITHHDNGEFSITYQEKLMDDKGADND